jgi:hypothetical protein
MYVKFEANKNGNNNMIRGNEAYPAEWSNRTLRNTWKKTEPYNIQQEDKNDNVSSPTIQVDVPDVQDTPRPMVIENEKQLQQPVMNINKTKSKVTGKKISKKKGKANLQLPISSHIQPYSMIEDIKHQQAWITFGQLIEMAPKCKTELRKPTTRKIHFSDMKLEENQRSTAMYCNAIYCKRN